jgi:hypothetical protein
MTKEAMPSAVQRRAQEAWESFCEELKCAGSQLIRQDLPLGELDAAEGLRYLSRMVRTGLERHVESADPANTILYALSDERIKGFGGDNPDTRYFGASLSSDYTYQLSGDFQSCAYVSLMTNGFDEQGGYQITGSLDSDGMPESRKGPVEIVISGGEVDDTVDAAGTGRANRTLTTTDDTQSLLVRCTFDDLAAKDGLRLSLTRIDSQGEPVHCAFEPIAKGLLETAKFVRTTAESCANQSVGLRQNFNRLPLQDPERIRKAGGDPNVFYYSAGWSVAEDEYLVIQLSPIPDCTTWGLQINNLWTESLDYTQAQIHLNKSNAQLNADGGVTIIVSERDPGRANWLRTMGHRSGTANLRLMGAKEPLEAEVRVVGSVEDL